MKKITLMLCIFSLLTAVGCSNETAPDSSESTAETQLTIIIEPTTEAETTQPATEAVTTSTETSPIETTVPANSAAVSSETAALTSETTTTVSATENDPYTGGDITGIWAFPDGYQMYFMENNTAELRVDYGSTMYFEDNVFHHYDDHYNVHVDGGTVTAMKDGEVFLRMTATEQADIETLSGRYYLEDCEFKKQYFADESGYFIDTAGTSLRIVAMAQYTTEGNVLSLSRNGSEVISRYGVNGDELQIIDNEGYVDTLTRVN